MSKSKRSKLILATQNEDDSNISVITLEETSDENSLPAVDPILSDEEKIETLEKSSDVLRFLSNAKNSKSNVFSSIIVPRDKNSATALLPLNKKHSTVSNEAIIKKPAKSHLNINDLICLDEDEPELTSVNRHESPIKVHRIRSRLVSRSFDFDPLNVNNENPKGDEDQMNRDWSMDSEISSEDTAKTKAVLKNLKKSDTLPFSLNENAVSYLHIDNQSSKNEDFVKKPRSMEDSKMTPSSMVIQTEGYLKPESMKTNRITAKINGFVVKLDSSVIISDQKLMSLSEVNLGDRISLNRLDFRACKFKVEHIGDEERTPKSDEKITEYESDDWLNMSSTSCKRKRSSVMRPNRSSANMASERNSSALNIETPWHVKTSKSSDYRETTRLKSNSRISMKVSPPSNLNENANLDYESSQSPIETKPAARVKTAKPANCISPELVLLSSGDSSSLSTLPSLGGFVTSKISDTSIQTLSDSSRTNSPTLDCSKNVDQNFDSRSRRKSDVNSKKEKETSNLDENNNEVYLETPTAMTVNEHVLSSKRKESNEMLKSKLEKSCKRKQTGEEEVFSISNTIESSAGSHSVTPRIVYSDEPPKKLAKIDLEKKKNNTEVENASKSAKKSDGQKVSASNELLDVRKEKRIISEQATTRQSEKTTTTSYSKTQSSISISTIQKSSLSASSNKTQSTTTFNNFKIPRIAQPQGVESFFNIDNNSKNKTHSVTTLPKPKTSEIEKAKLITKSPMFRASDSKSSSKTTKSNGQIITQSGSSATNDSSKNTKTSSSTLITAETNNNKVKSSVSNKTSSSSTVAIQNHTNSLSKKSNKVNSSPGGSSKNLVVKFSKPAYDSAQRELLTIAQLTDKRTRFNESYNLKTTYLNWNFLLHDYVKRTLPFLGLDVKYLSANLPKDRYSKTILGFEDLKQENLTELCRLMSRSCGRINFFHLLGLDCLLVEYPKNYAQFLSDTYGRLMREYIPTTINNTEINEPLFLAQAQNLTLSESMILLRRLTNRLTIPFKTVGSARIGKSSVRNFEVKFENDNLIESDDSSYEAVVKYVLHREPRDDAQLIFNVLHKQVVSPPNELESKKGPEVLKLDTFTRVQEKVNDTLLVNTLYVNRFIDNAYYKVTNKPNNYAVHSTNYSMMNTNNRKRKHGVIDDPATKSNSIPVFISHFNVLRPDRGHTRRAIDYKLLSQEESELRIKKLKNEKNIIIDNK